MFVSFFFLFFTHNDDDMFLFLIWLAGTYKTHYIQLENILKLNRNTKNLIKKPLKAKTQK